MLKLAASAVFFVAGLAGGAAVSTATAAPVDPRWLRTVEDRCPESPVPFDSGGHPRTEPVGACSAPPQVGIFGLKRSEAGWIVHASFGLEAYADDGRRRWRYDNRSNCRLFYSVLHCSPVVTGFLASDDGGAWVLENTEAPESRYHPGWLVRLDNAGRTRQRVDLSTLPHFEAAEYVDTTLMPSDEGVVLFWTHAMDGWGSIGQLRISNSGAMSTAEIPIAAAGSLSVHAAVPMPDGDTLLVYSPNAFVRYCWMCLEPLKLAVARVGPHGTLRWKWDTQVHEAQTYAINRQGAWIGGRGFGVELQQIDASGNRSAVVRHPGFAQAERFEVFCGIGREVLFTTRTGIQALDATGQVRTAHLWSADEAVFLERGDSGPETLAIALWGGSGADHVIRLDAASLEVAMRARFDERATFNASYPFVASATDGMVAALRLSETQDQRLFAQLARFDVPGSVADLEIFSDGVEP